MKKMICLFFVTLMCHGILCASGHPSTVAIIEGDYDHLQADTLYFAFYADKFGNTELGADHQQQVIHDGKFKFRIRDIRRPGYFTLSSASFNHHNGKNIPLYSYLVEPGDSIHLSVFEDQGIRFTGNNPGKYRCRFAIDTMDCMDHSKPRVSISPEAVKEDVDNLLNSMRTDRAMVLQLKKLEQYRKEISPLAYEVMKCDVIAGLICMDRYIWFSIEWPNTFVYPDSLIRKKKMSDFFHEFIDIDPDVSEAAKMISCKYQDLLAARISLATKIRLNLVVNRDCSLNYGIYKKLKENFRDKSLLSYLSYMSHNPGIQHFDSCIRDALTALRDPHYAALLQNMMEKNALGADVYPFVLPDKDKQPVSIRDFKGKVVLIDFWFTGCGACMNCADKLKKIMAHYRENQSLVFMSISCDRDYGQWIKSVKEGKYTPGEGEINLYTEGNGMEHPLINYYYINGYPRLILIGKNGKIFDANPPRPDSKDGIALLNARIDAALRQ